MTIDEQKEMFNKCAICCVEIDQETSCVENPGTQFRRCWECNKWRWEGAAYKPIPPNEWYD